MPVTSQASLASTLPSLLLSSSSPDLQELSRLVVPCASSSLRGLDDAGTAHASRRREEIKARRRREENGLQTRLSGDERSAGFSGGVRSFRRPRSVRLLLIGQLGRVDCAAGIGGISAARESFHRQLPRHPYGMSPRERPSQTEEQRQLVSESGTPMLTSDNRSPPHPPQQASCSSRGNHRLRPPRAAETSRKAK